MSSIRLLRERGLRPKKSFGQNFLQDKAICLKIAALCTTPPGGTVLEASGEFADLVGRPIEISGIVEFGENGPEAAPGQIVIG